MDTVSKIAGLLDLASFDDGVTAQGSKVVAEVAQVIDKTSAIIDALDQLDAADIAEAAARAAADIALGARIDVVQGNVDDTNARIDLIEQNSWGILVKVLRNYPPDYENGSFSYTFLDAEITQNRTILVEAYVENNAVEDMTLNLPSFSDNMAPVTIVNCSTAESGYDQATLKVAGAGLATQSVQVGQSITVAYRKATTMSSAAWVVVSKYAGV